MEDIKINAKERSPEVDFNFSTNTFSLSGESYPEDIPEFFGPIIEKLEQHLKAQKKAKIVFNFKLIYFNSSSARVLLGIFDLLDETAKNNTVEVNWFYEDDDDNMEELGEEFGEDLENANFNLRPIEEG